MAKETGSPGSSDGGRPKRGQRAKRKPGAQGNRTQRGHLTAAKQLVRDALIVTMKIDGQPWKAISEHPEVNLSVNACQDVHRAYLRDPERGLAIDNAREIVVEASLKFERFEERMGELYAKEVGKSGDRTSNLIGLTKTQAAMVEKRVTLLQASAILPQEIGVIRHIEDVKEILTTLARILDEEGVPQRVWDRLFDELPLMPERRENA